MKSVSSSFQNIVQLSSVTLFVVASFLTCGSVYSAAVGPVSDIVSKRKKQKSQKKKRKNKISPLHQACKAGDLEQVIKLCSASEDVDVNQVATNGYAPIHYAVDMGHSEIVKFLASKGAEFLDFRKEKSLMQLAVSSRQADVVAVLIEVECPWEYDDHNFEKWVSLGIKEQGMVILQTLSSQGVDLAAYQGREDTNLLHAVAATGCYEKTHWVGETFHDLVSEAKKCLISPLHLAAKHPVDDYKALEYLIMIGFKPNEQDYLYKRTPLHYAVYLNKPKTARFLRKEIDVDTALEDMNGRTAHDDLADEGVVSASC